MLLDEVRQILVTAMTPYIGAHMANAAVQSHCEKLNLTGSLTPAQIADLVHRLGVGLNIFVGKERSARVVAEMTAVLKGGRP